MKLLARLGTLLGTRRAARAPVVEELEPRILYSADLNPALLIQDPDVVQVRSSTDAVATPPAIAAAEQQQRRSHEIVFVDAAVPDAQTLIDGLLAQRGATADIEVVRLRADAGGLQQIADVLAGERDIDAVHIVSHG